MMMDDTSHRSVTVLGRVLEEPTSQAWEIFFRHYWSRVYRWALAILRNTNAAEEVVSEVFRRLYMRITKSELPRVTTDENGSFRPYVYVVVRDVCLAYRRSEARRARIGLSEADVDRLADPSSIDDLCDQLAETEEVSLKWRRLGEQYQTALADLKAAPQFDPVSFEAYLRVYHRGERCKDLDAEFEKGPGWASKTSNRVRDRLLNHLAARDGRGELARAELNAVLDDLVRIHGDPPR
jgi:DNA-directed RNA polymerase specialized sigma24 family protein